MGHNCSWLREPVPIPLHVEPLGHVQGVFHISFLPDLAGVQIHYVLASLHVPRLWSLDALAHQPSQWLG